MPFFTTPSSPVRQWLQAELSAVARQLERDDVRAVATTVANSALWDPDMDARREGFAHTLRERLAAALLTAQANGEVELLGDPLQAAALVIGPLYYRSTIEHQIISDEVLAASIDALGRWAG